MKRKILFAGVLLVAVIGAMNVNLGLNAPDSELMLANVEALAQGEGGESGCMGSGSVVCNGVAKYYGRYY